MTITIETKMLRTAAAEAAAVALGGGGEPAILSHALLHAEGPHLRIYASDLDLAVERQVGLAEPCLPGAGLRTTVNARLLAAIAAKLPAEAQASLSLDGGKVLLTAGRARFTLPALPAEEFPEFPAEEAASTFEMAAIDLARLIDAVSFAICSEETRYYLNGIYFHRHQAPGGVPMLRAAATDGHRLARFQLPLPDGAETLGEHATTAGGVIVPTKAVKLIRKLCDAGEEKLTLAISERRIRIEAGETVLTSKLIDGTFPDYTRVIPSANDKLLGIDRNALREAVERVVVISGDKTRAVRIDIEKDKAVLTVTSAANGTGIEELPCDYAGAPLTIGLNAKYLLDIIAATGGDELDAALADAAAPVKIEPRTHGEGAVNGEGEKLFVIMPMRV